MEAWPSAKIPSLFDAGFSYGPALHIYDSAQRRLTAVDPAQTARMYVCGITPYDATHLGHASTYVVFDIVQRIWRDRGLAVNYTQNVTDIDDPLLERAADIGVDWHELAQSQTRLFTEDMEALRVIPPDHYFGAVETIDLVVAMIQRLQAAGSVYRLDNDLYFRVRQDREFGSVSGFDDAAMLEVFADRGGDPERSGKADKFDCLVWKGEVPGEPAWDSVLGRGRPGWHIECAAIALEYLGTNFDIQGGGSDLAFPHHEMSAAQGRIATGREFAQTFMHTGMVALDGDKMSKSKGNLELVSRLREAGTDPMAVRLAILAHHYRWDWQWSDAVLSAAADRLAAWISAVQRAAGPPAGPAIDAMRHAVTNDVDTPGALAVVDEWADTAGSDPAAPAHMATAVDSLLGVEV